MGSDRLISVTYECAHIHTGGSKNHHPWMKRDPEGRAERAGAATGPVGEADLFHQDHGVRAHRGTTTPDHCVARGLPVTGHTMSRGLVGAGLAGGLVHSGRSGIMLR